ncbi:MAG: hypothetical protein K6B65_06025 [Bacilli bacterium]|nr:hypothetical protein [Bacilli bacterium]
MQHLNYSWRFLPGYEPSYLKATPSSAISVDLPHSAVKLPFHEFDERKLEGIFTYILEFNDEEPLLPVKILHFDGVMLKAHVYFNNVDLGEKISGFFPIEFDVSTLIKPKGNRLVVVVDSKEDPLIPPFGNIVDYLLYAGIYRKVRLLSYPSSYIEDVYPYAEADGRVEVKLALAGAPKEEKPFLRVFDEDKCVYEGEDTSFVVPNIFPWSPESPKLYRLDVIYCGATYSKNFGFRTIEWKEDGFYLNGVKTKLIGLNRHQCYPYFGMAAPDSVQKEDVRILKRSGINVVRTSHYGDDESFLDECDRLGLLFLNEVPGWQHIGKEEGWRYNFLDFVRRLVLKERHHTALIAFGLRIDESIDDHDLYSKGLALQRELDPHHFSIGVRNFKDSECLEDIYGYNDFSNHDLSHGLDKPSSWGGAKGKPKLVTENNGHMFPTKPWDNTERKLEHALRHAKVMDDGLGMDGLCGELAWCAFDYASHSQFGSGDRMDYHGVYDAFRNPKPAAYFYMSQGEEPFLEVANNIDRGDINESMMKPLVVFTNADKVRFYRGEDYVGEFYPNKKDYPHLKHAPIVIDDYIGSALRLDGYNEKELSFLKKALNAFGAGGGMDSFSIGEKLFALKIMKKHNLAWPDLQQLYQRYMSNFGPNDHFRIEAVYNDRVYLTKVIGISRSYHYEVKSPEELNNGICYEAGRIAIAKRNEFGMLAPYSFDIGHVEVEGPIENMGEDEFVLMGGQAAIFVRSLPTKKPTLAKVKIIFGDETIVKEIVIR